MSSVWFYSLVSVLIVSLVSLIGIATLSINRKFLNQILLLLVSFAAGTLLGDVFFHILPEVLEEELLSPLTITSSILFGILIFFVLEKIVHWRHCHIVGDESSHTHPLAIVNLFGDGVHNFIDGMVIAASYMISFQVGLATTIAVIFHEIPQEIGEFGILVHSGMSRLKAVMFNLCTALTAVFGALLVLIVGNSTETFSLYLLPITAGGFIYIACADLFPELHKESETGESILQLSFLTLGLVCMYLLMIIE